MIYKNGEFLKEGNTEHRKTRACYDGGRTSLRSSGYCTFSYHQDQRFLWSRHTSVYLPQVTSPSSKQQNGAHFCCRSMCLQNKQSRLMRKTQLGDRRKGVLITRTKITNTHNTTERYRGNEVLINHTKITNTSSGLDETRLTESLPKGLCCMESLSRPPPSPQPGRGQDNANGHAA